MAFEETLKELKAAGAAGVAVVSRDGTILGADLGPEISRETFSIMCATIYGASMTVSAELRRPNPNRITLESAQGRVVIAEAGRRALVVMILSSAMDADKLSTILPPILSQVAKETGRVT